MVLRISSTIW